MLKLKDLKGEFRAVATLNSENCLENADKIAADIIAQVKAQGGEAIRKGDLVEVVGGNQYWHLPKMPKIREGKLTFRSKDFVFDYGGERPSYGSKPKAADITEDGFILTMFNGATINYKLEREV